MSDTYGKSVTLTIFGESHGPAVGATVTVPVFTAPQLHIHSSRWNRIILPHIWDIHFIPDMIHLFGINIIMMIVRQCVDFTDGISLILYFLRKI